MKISCRGFNNESYFLPWDDSDPSLAATGVRFFLLLSLDSLSPHLGRRSHSLCTQQHWDWQSASVSYQTCVADEWRAVLRPHCSHNKHMHGVSLSEFSPVHDPPPVTVHVDLNGLVGLLWPLKLTDGGQSGSIFFPSMPVHAPHHGLAHAVK